jgi:hypothetical protein
VFALDLMSTYEGEHTIFGLLSKARFDFLLYAFYSVVSVPQHCSYRMSTSCIRIVQFPLSNPKGRELNSLDFLMSSIASFLKAVPVHPSPKIASYWPKFVSAKYT